MSPSVVTIVSLQVVIALSSHLLMIDCQVTDMCCYDINYSLINAETTQIQLATVLNASHVSDVCTVL